MITPGSGSGSTRRFTVVYEHPSGWQTLSVLNVRIHLFLDGPQACYLAYTPAHNALCLVDDPGNAGARLPGQ